MQKEDRFLKGHHVRRCPFFPQNQVKTKKQRPQTFDCSETLQSFSWKNDLACFHSSYNTKKEDIWPFFGVLGGQIFLVKKEDVCWRAYGI